MLAEVETITNVTQLGVAGFICAMWLWERRQSRKRDEQLDDAHDRILADGVKIQELMQVVRTNSEAMTNLAAAVRHVSGDNVK